MDVVDDRVWDGFVADLADGHHEQTTRYGELRREHGFDVDRVVIMQGNDVMGGAQVLVRSSPVGRFAHVYRAPLVRGSDPLLCARVVAALEDRARAARWSSLRVDTFPSQIDARKALDRAAFVPTSTWTDRCISRACLLDVDRDSLFAAMTSKGRYNVRRAERYGVEVRVGGLSDVPSFFELHQGTAKHQGFPVFPESYFRDTLEVFGESGRAFLFMAYLGDVPIAAIFDMIVGRRMYYCWGGMDRRPHHARTMANYLLHFRAMNVAREHGCVEYDLVGDSEFKRKLTDRVVPWPAPRRKFFGLLSSARERLFEYSGTRPRVRSLITRAVHRLGLEPTMPW